MQSNDVELADYAMRCIGGRARLAKALELPVEELDRYLKGEALMPHRVFVGAIDIATQMRPLPGTKSKQRLSAVHES
jgi:hypothetical protein